jgi:hypothetical protein
MSSLRLTGPVAAGLAALLAWPASADAAPPAQGELPDTYLPKQPLPIPSAPPIVAIDDTRTHGPVARDWLNLSVDGSLLTAPESTTGGRFIDEDVYGITPQLSVGVPGATQVNLNDILAPYDVYELRVRGAVFWHDGNALGGPLTVAFQHYFPISRLDFPPLAAAHFGLETAISTPWLSGRLLTPPIAVRILDGVDSEMVQSGWSLRPLTAYVRGDFLACRSFYLELGGAPEVFLPDGGPTGYDARFHLAGGWSFSCANQPVTSRPKVSLEYRGRVGLPTSDQSARYSQSAAAALQIDFGCFTGQVFVAVDPDHADYQTYGFRLQVGLEKIQAQN